MKNMFSNIFSFSYDDYGIYLRIFGIKIKLRSKTQRRSFRKHKEYLQTKKVLNGFVRTMEDCYIYRIDIDDILGYVKYIKTQHNVPVYLLSDLGNRGGGQIKPLWQIKICKNGKKSKKR